MINALHPIPNYGLDGTAKNDRTKSDLVIRIPGYKDPVGIEVKTTLDTEFGQLTVGYDTERERWVIHNSNFNKGKSKDAKTEAEQEKEQLLRKIGELTVELDFLKKRLP